MQKEITVKENQSLFDVCLQELGSIESAFQLSISNGKGITDSLEAAEKLVINTTINEKNVVTHYSNKKIIPATAIDITDDLQKNSGIGSMGIQIDFIVTKNG